MRTVPSAFRTHMGLESTTMGRLLRITREDGTVIRLSSTGRDEVYDGDTYLGDPGFVSSSVTVETKRTPFVDVDFGAEIGSDDPVTAEDVNRGVYSRAIVEVFRLNYEDATQAFLEVRAKVGSADFSDSGVLRFDTRGGTDDLAGVTVEKFAVNCTVQVGSPRCGVPVMPADVERSTAYDVGDYVRVDQSGYGNRMFRCITAGTTAGSAPSYDYTVGNDTTDGSAVFRSEQAWLRQGTVSTVDSRFEFTAAITESRAVNGWFDNGQIIFTSGLNDGMIYDVRKWVQGSGTVSLWTRARYDIAPGDTFEIYPGCDKTTGANGCARFSNIVNYQGFPHMPGKQFRFEYADVDGADD